MEHKTTDEKLIECVKYALKSSDPQMLWQLADIFTRRGHFEEKAKELLSSLDSHQIT